MDHMHDMGTTRAEYLTMIMHMLIREGMYLSPRVALHAYILLLSCTMNGQYLEGH